MDDDCLETRDSISHAYVHAHTHTHTHTHTDTPSGAAIHQLLSSIAKGNSEVADLLSFWKDLLSAGLDTAKKFDNDYKYVEEANRSLYIIQSCNYVLIK